MTSLLLQNLETKESLFGWLKLLISVEYVSTSGSLHQLYFMSLIRK